MNYYNECPFEKGKLYNKGIYIGRYDGWSSDFGSFIFEANGKKIFIHPTDVTTIESIHLL